MNRRAQQQHAVSYIVIQLSENVLHLEVCSLDTVPTGYDAVLAQHKLNSPSPILWETQLILVLYEMFRVSVPGTVSQMIIRMHLLSVPRV
jgi:hypothetical protein